jgi:predicted Zn-dependent peptidase
VPAPPEMIVLRNGARVALEQRPHLASAAVVLRLAGGTREEAAHEAGLTHLLEHLLLRRTARSDPAALAARVAALGGQVNAETGREHLLLGGRAPAGQAAELAALLVECVAQPRFDPHDLALEQGVLAAERTFVGQPATDAVIRLAWPDHPLGRPPDPPATPPASLPALHALLGRLRGGLRVTAAVTGAFDADAVRAAFAPLADWPAGAPPAYGPPPRFVPGCFGDADVHRAGELWWALPCVPCEAPHTAWALAAAVLEQALTRAVRTAGLAYACAVWPELYSDAGVILARVRAPAGGAAACVRAVEGCLESLARCAPTPAQVALAQRAHAAGLALERDDLAARARTLAGPAAPTPAGCLAPARLGRAWLRLWI